MTSGVLSTFASLRHRGRNDCRLRQTLRHREPRVAAEKY